MGPQPPRQPLCLLAAALCAVAGMAFSLAGEEDAGRAASAGAAGKSGTDGDDLAETPISSAPEAVDPANIEFFEKCFTSWASITRS